MFVCRPSTVSWKEGEAHDRVRDSSWLDGSSEPSGTARASATATRDLPGYDGVPVAASTVQSASLATIADLFGIVVGKPDDITE